MTGWHDANHDAQSAIDWVMADFIDSDDEVVGNRTGNRLNGGVGNDIVRGRGGEDVVYGGAGNDHVYGGAENDYVYGDFGPDDESNDGDDYLYGGKGNDHLFGGGGDDRLFGARGDDHLYGGGGDDHLYGGNGGDHLYGGDGSDRLYGGKDNDYLEGGKGQDRFVFDELRFGKDRIGDFEDGIDLLDFSNSGLTWHDLSVSNDRDGNAVVQVNDSRSRVILDGVDAADIDENDFIF